MSQAKYELFNQIFGMYHVICQVIFFVILWNIFCQLEKDRKGAIAAGGFAAVNLLLALYQGTPAGMRYTISAVIVLGYCCFRYQKHIEKAVFVLLLFYNFHALSFLIADSIYQYGMNFLLGGLDVLDPDYLYRMYEKAAAGELILAGIYTLSFLMMILIIKKIVKKPFLLGWHDAAFLSVLNIVGGMLAGMVRDLTIVKIENEVFLLFDEREEMLWKVPLIAVLIYVGEISAIYTYQKYRELQAERQRLFVEEQQMKAIRRRLEEAEQFYGNIRKVRHEMKNHMMNMKGLIVGENYEAVEHYMERLDQTIQNLDYRFATGNAVTDVILNDKYRKAQNAGISFEVQFSYMETDTIPVFDIGIILSNLLDNAMEACEKLDAGQKYISLKLKRRNHFLLIEVENSFDGVLKWDTYNEIPATTKQQELPDILMEHGIGLKNVKDVAEHYLGGIDIRVKENVFHITVMLQQKEEES